ncbi:MAG: cytidylyltransferase domain-containing protein, partial [Candidatus Nanopelagicales bacterium]
MLQDKRVLVVIPARGGSKGIPHKNITPVAGKPLIRYTTELLAKLTWIDAAVVSTDDQDIAAE